METGTQILIERMKTHPEEFIEGGHSKWARVIDMSQCLPDEDRKTLEDAYKRLRIDRFNETVLKTLAGEVDLEEVVRYKASERYSAGFSDPRAFANAAVKAEGRKISDHIDAQVYATAIGRK